MRRWLPLLILVVGVGAVLLADAGLLEPRGEPVDVEFAALSLDEPFVRTELQAHYEALVTQTIPANLLHEEQKLWLFAAFAPYDSEGRQVRLLVRTARPPDKIASFEMMTVTGQLVRPTPATVPMATEEQLGRHTDYFFTDDVLLLEPWRIDVEGEDPWLEPE